MKKWFVAYLTLVLVLWVKSDRYMGLWRLFSDVSSTWRRRHVNELILKASIYNLFTSMNL
jgi:hypothetical protein